MRPVKEHLARVGTRAVVNRAEATDVEEGDKNKQCRDATAGG
jgi:hypothetical protein